jgi:hypothetical protein
VFGVPTPDGRRIRVVLECVDRTTVKTAKSLVSRTKAVNREWLVAAPPGPLPCRLGRVIGAEGALVNDLGASKHIFAPIWRLFTGTGCFESPAGVCGVVIVCVSSQ